MNCCIAPMGHDGGVCDVHVQAHILFEMELQTRAGERRERDSGVSFFKEFVVHTDTLEEHRKASLRRNIVAIFHRRLHT
jgi:hypothetical protein